MLAQPGDAGGVGGGGGQDRAGPGSGRDDETVSGVKRDKACGSAVMNPVVRYG